MITPLPFLLGRTRAASIAFGVALAGASLPLLALWGASCPGTERGHGGGRILDGMIRIDSLLDVVDYDAQRRASKVAFAVAGVRAVVFAFAAGQELAEHRAPAPILLQSLEGELRIAALASLALIPCGVAFARLVGRALPVD